MATYNTLETEQSSFVATVWLNRPKVHNALNGEMIHELLLFFTEIACKKDIRAVVIRGRGDSFCSGADLNWMKEVSKYNYDQNFLESKTLAKCLLSINESSKVVISVVHGAVMGGANGLVAASDIVIANESARFRFSEVSLGLVPAIISPYVIDKIGYSQARRLMLQAEEFNSLEANRLGLAHYLVTDTSMETKLAEVIGRVLSNSPEAIQNTKMLFEKLHEVNDVESLVNLTSEAIAKARVSDDGQKGMTAFFNKQKPEWVVAYEKIIAHVN
jgi:methylglutaconyl-CoA hydratase